MDIHRMRSGSTDNLRQLPELGKTDNAKLLGFRARLCVAAIVAWIGGGEARGRPANGPNRPRLCKNFRAFSHEPVSFAFSGPETVQR
jgi:hypothetical protein